MDPHSRSANGTVSEKCTAVLLKFPNVESVNNHIQVLYQNTALADTEFNIIPILCEM